MGKNLQLDELGQSGRNVSLPKILILNIGTYINIGNSILDKIVLLFGNISCFLKLNILSCTWVKMSVFAGKWTLIKILVRAREYRKKTNFLKTPLLGPYLGGLNVKSDFSKLGYLCVLYRKNRFFQFFHYSILGNMFKL